MGCWSFTFPLVGFFMANAKLGSILPSTTFSSVQVLGIFIVGIAWLINGALSVRLCRCAQVDR